MVKLQGLFLLLLRFVLEKYVCYKMCSADSALTNQEKFDLRQYESCAKECYACVFIMLSINSDLYQYKTLTSLIVTSKQLQWIVVDYFAIGHV
jgi:hypothetical protein